MIFVYVEFVSRVPWRSVGLTTAHHTVMFMYGYEHYSCLFNVSASHPANTTSYFQQYLRTRPVDRFCGTIFSDTSGTLDGARICKTKWIRQIPNRLRTTYRHIQVRVRAQGHTAWGQYTILGRTEDVHLRNKIDITVIAVINIEKRSFQPTHCFEQIFVFSLTGLNFAPVKNGFDRFVLGTKVLTR